MHLCSSSSENKESPIQRSGKRPDFSIWYVMELRNIVFGDQHRRKYEGVQKEATN